MSADIARLDALAGRAGIARLAWVRGTTVSEPTLRARLAGHGRLNADELEQLRSRLAAIVRDRISTLLVVLEEIESGPVTQVSTGNPHKKVDKPPEAVETLSMTGGL